MVTREVVTFFKKVETNFGKITGGLTEVLKRLKDKRGSGTPRHKEEQDAEV